MLEQNEPFKREEFERKQLCLLGHTDIPRYLLDNGYVVVAL